ncbi:hypothetical protein A3B45_00395 [Candidatus Daviesbacteria bacterium RIFCSPLOWO2_01_FULL_39_12]|uniref:Methyltransferase type 12 domain-containing protein n=1 Tax=Candidatus Daviesbacteria bacterium RIFCSPLOWO2_01_FULL_39_12 TaxID=1797785 RepID=A0A1F5KPA8_9BACT|nr:MAG: hypothetical protein A3B45_00395 [Candidatus Daviesbacteria bacterium RIFCSPLOWO2_01_FULL_39_12]
MKKQQISSYAAWKPSKPISRGAQAYHQAVTYASWHIDNMAEMIRLVERRVRTDDIVVDFGAGTGSSTIYIIRDIPRKFFLFLVDNSPSWLGNAYSIFHTNPNVRCLLLEKNQDQYQTLDELMGRNSVNHVLSANTVHLIPNIADAFEGIYRALKEGGTFTFQSGNISRQGREKGVLMIDDSVERIHDIAISIIRRDNRYKHYQKDLNKRMQVMREQRKFVFPDPRPLNYYVEILKKIGFRNIRISHKKIKVSYKDWLSFLRVGRLQAGILPEIGGIKLTAKEEHDRDEIITKASHLLFDELKKHNALANHKSFTTEWVYVQSQK